MLYDQHGHPISGTEPPKDEKPSNHHDDRWYMRWQFYVAVAASVAGIVASAAVISQCAAKQEGNRLRGPDVVERILVPSCLPKAGEYVTVIFKNSGPRAATKFKANLQVAHANGRCPDRPPFRRKLYGGAGESTVPRDTPRQYDLALEKDSRPGTFLMVYGLFKYPGVDGIMERRSFYAVYEPLNGCRNYKFTFCPQSDSLAAIYDQATYVPESGCVGRMTAQGQPSPDVQCEQ